VDGEEVLVIMMSSLGILAGVAVIWMAMQSRRQIREMEHRERLAMIERGLVPSPEVDPGAFERKFGAVRVLRSPGAVRARSSGVVMITLGLAFMSILSFTAGEPGVGIGIGGAFVLVGAGFLLNAVLIGRSEAAYSPSVASQVEPPRHRPTDAPQ
jgi:uncharacterized protein DUF6249